MSTTYHCEHCHDTGRLPGSDYFDCVYCDAAEQRIALRDALTEFADADAGAFGNDDMTWFIHQRATRMAAEQIAKQTRERDQAEKRIISSTDAFKRIAQAHLAALRATNGDASEIARLAAYVEPQAASHAVVGSQDKKDAELWRKLIAAENKTLLHFYYTRKDYRTAFVDGLPPAPQPAQQEGGSNG